MVAETTLHVDTPQPSRFDSICYMAFVRAAQIASFLSAGLVCASNVWMTVTIAPYIQNIDDFFSLLIPVYNVFLSAAIMVSIFNLTCLVRNMYFLLTYFGLGLFQMFVGLLTLGAKASYASLAVHAGNFSTSVDVVRIVSGWILFGVGLIYILMGILGFPQLHGRKEFLKLSRSTMNVADAV